MICGPLWVRLKVMVGQEREAYDVVALLGNVYRGRVEVAEVVTVALF